MRKFSIWLALGLTICLCVGLFTGAMAETASDTAQEPLEIHMAAVGLMITVPADLEALGGDEDAYDLGFRYDGYSIDDTFDLTLWVHDARDMTIKDYAAFYASRYSCTDVKLDSVNGFPVYRLTNPASPDLLTVLVGEPENDTPDAVYALSFSCDNQKAWQLEESILKTLAVY